MIHSLYIITENGICLFAQHFIDTQIDNQLISGFINALGAFATEALGSGMQSLKLQTGDHLSVLRYTAGAIPLIGMVIADSRDNDILIRNILQEILVEFCSLFEKSLRESPLAEISKYAEFNYVVDDLLANKIASRTNFKMFLGIFVGLLMIGVITLAFIPAIFQIDNLNPADLGIGDIIFSDGLDPTDLKSLQTITLLIIGSLMLVFCTLFSGPTVLAAYIAGDRKRGVWTAILLGISVGVIIAISSPFVVTFAEVNALLWYIAFAPLLLFLDLVFGYYGGRLKERRKLYPLPEKSFDIF
ncbi:MAG: hypothetical protein EU536_00650 [Promethearchaeota archaeon]|nr:MAG: hypothetical protein EU536_00650 [Candidatus Lokiarchaeota archaeon]